MKNVRMSLLATLIAGLGISSTALAQKAEVIHWWTSGGESAALKQLAEAYNKAGGQWVDNAIAGGDNARAAALNRIAGGNAPAASQFNTSKQYHELIDAGMLADVDEVAAKEGLGLLICGSGIGMSIRANRYKGVRAALCWDNVSARLSRQHNDANILCIGARLIPLGLAEEMAETFLKTTFEGGRHQGRVEKLDC